MKFLKALLTATVLTAIGCSNEMGLDETLKAAGAACQVDPSSHGLKVVGASGNQSGSVAQYSLNKDGVCVPGDNVHWKAAGATKTLTTQAGLNSVFQRAGTYVISGREKLSTTTQQPSLRTTVVSNDLKLAGPQLAFSYFTLQFEIVAPQAVTVESVTWDFGDGSAPILGSTQHEYTYYADDVFFIKASVLDTEGQIHELEHRIKTISYIDGDDCALDLSIAGASEAKVNIATAMHVYIPACLADKIGAVRWDFGDGESASDQSVSHTYAEEGLYSVTAVLYENGSTTEPFVTLDHLVRVTEDLVIGPDPEEPVDPNACAVEGQTRESTGELYTEHIACGLNGTKVVTYRDHIQETCSVQGGSKVWTEATRTQEVTHEGECEGQSCRLPNGELLANGASKVLFSSSTPAGSCESVSETRTCQNGNLSGSSSFSEMTCFNGCGDFGSHGTVKTDITIGEVQLPLTCEFGEQGFFDLYNQVADKTCVDGSIQDSNIRQGSIKAAGSCPSYSHAPTDNFTSCSADCGGTQQRVFICRDDQGNQVDGVRCKTASPVEERLCDANPEAVRSQQVTTSNEEANSSNLCPKNQIGTIVKTREVTKTQTFACIDHKVQQESETIVPGPWVEESYCRDYVARRCSQDSLSNAQAKGRYEWMQKCKEELPLIKEFLENFENVKVKAGSRTITMSGSGQELYPTFMNYATTPEKPWIAPKTKSAKCEMPSTVYVATVCVSSCTTPEQQIMVRDDSSRKMKYIPIIDALLNDVDHVASLANEASAYNSKVAKTKVDQWVTELIDTEHDILVFTMKSGRELRLTPNHTLVTAEGNMKVAEQFTTKDSLVMLGGVLDPIVSITPIKHFGKVYNVFVQSNDPYRNILVTNGYLNGSAYYQNEGAKDLNRTLLRKKLTNGVFK